MHGDEDLEIAFGPCRCSSGVHASYKDPSLFSAARFEPFLFLSILVYLIGLWCGGKAKPMGGEGICYFYTG